MQKEVLIMQRLLHIQHRKLEASNDNSDFELNCWIDSGRHNLKLDLKMRTKLFLTAITSLCCLLPSRGKIQFAHNFLLMSSNLAVSHSHPISLACVDCGDCMCASSRVNDCKTRGKMVLSTTDLHKICENILIFSIRNTRFQIWWKISWGELLMKWSYIFPAKRAINQVIKLGWNELTRSILGEMCFSVGLSLSLSGWAGVRTIAISTRFQSMPWHNLR